METVADKSSDTRQAVSIFQVERTPERELMHGSISPLVQCLERRTPRRNNTSKIVSPFSDSIIDNQSRKRRAVMLAQSTAMIKGAKTRAETYAPAGSTVSPVAGFLERVRLGGVCSALSALAVVLRFLTRAGTSGRLRALVHSL